MFWLDRPPLLLIPIKLVLFLCSFFYACFIFFAWQFGSHSCPFRYGVWLEGWEGSLCLRHLCRCAERVRGGMDAVVSAPCGNQMRHSHLVSHRRCLIPTPVTRSDVFYRGWALPWWTIILFTSIMFIHISWVTLPTYSLAVQVGGSTGAVMRAGGVRHAVGVGAEAANRGPGLHSHCGMSNCMSDPNPMGTHVCCRHCRWAPTGRHTCSPNAC